MDQVVNIIETNALGLVMKTIKVWKDFPVYV